MFTIANISLTHKTVSARVQKLVYGLNCMSLLEYKFI
jgi:hypothetical protein